MTSAWCKVAGSSPAGSHDISIAQRVSGATKSGDVQTPLPAGVGGQPGIRPRFNKLYRVGGMW